MRMREKGREKRRENKEGKREGGDDADEDDESERTVKGVLIVIVVVNVVVNVVVSTFIIIYIGGSGEDGVETGREKVDASHGGPSCCNAAGDAAAGGGRGRKRAADLVWRIWGQGKETIWRADGYMCDSARRTGRLYTQRWQKDASLPTNRRGAEHT